MDGRSRSLRGRLACHCLLVELEGQLVLVDTGFGLRDVADPWSRLSKFFLVLLKPDFREEMTAIRQIQRLGYDPRDVRHIVLTHLDFDHAGGLDDFPHAAVHMLNAEREYATARPSLLDRMRYRPQQWGTRANWKVYPTGGSDRWMGFDCVRDLEGLPPEVLLVPLVGHTFGHSGVAVKEGGRWLLDAGDAYFYHAEMDTEHPYCTPGLRAYQWMMQKDGVARIENQIRLRALVKAFQRDVMVFCGHDPYEFERLSGHDTAAPADPGLRPAVTH
jgi:glyoxylase-like metal-dependent hydrolase (beta-lactamase superfamily II)